MENTILNNLLYITNWTKEDFIAKWNGNEYILQAEKMTPVVVSTPEENQEIRKLWALKLCERELNKDKRFKTQMWTDIDLEPLMSKCLTALEKVEPIVRKGVKPRREQERIANIEGTFKDAAEISGTVNNSVQVNI